MIQGKHSDPRIFSIPSGTPFLPELVDALLSGRLLPDLRLDEDPLALASATVYVPTRRAARELRATLAEKAGGRSMILPTIRALGEYDEEELAFLPGAESFDVPPPIAAMDRLLLLAPLVRAWKRRLPAHLARRFDEDIVVPASAADAIWFARDLADLLDEVETEELRWDDLAGVVDAELADWWQVTLSFLEIVTKHWPEILKERQQSDPSAYRSAMLRLEAARIRRDPPPGPLIAAGSTGSIPATADLLSAIASAPKGAVILPGLDLRMDEKCWQLVSSAQAAETSLGHPQYGLATLLRRIGARREQVRELTPARAALRERAAIVGEALRPPETTAAWVALRGSYPGQIVSEALSGISLVEAANERDEAAAIAVALRLATENPDHRAALVTGDRQLARRVSSELRRFGIEANDSGGTPLALTGPAQLLRLVVESALGPADPVTIVSLLKHPLFWLGLHEIERKEAVGALELVALRGVAARPDAMKLGQLFEERLAALSAASYPPAWLARVGASGLAAARRLAARLATALAPLVNFRGARQCDVGRLVEAALAAFEEIGRSEDGAVSRLYADEAGEVLADLLRSLIGSSAAFELDADEFADVLQALVSAEIIKPAVGGNERIAIWGALEARLQNVDTIVIGGLNEGSFPRKVDADRFMSRAMKTALGFEPPERRIGQAAHDFQMALGSPQVVLSRSSRSADAPAVASRWLQRLLAFIGNEEATKMKARGGRLLRYAAELDASPSRDFVARPCPAPPVSVRPRRFSVTEIETLRRDPYAIYARRILGLTPLEPLLRDPGAAERGTLFHEILYRFSAAGIDIGDVETARRHLLEVGREVFRETMLPSEVEAVWWPRFAGLADGFIEWERSRSADVLETHPELRADPVEVGRTGVMLSGYADRIDVLCGGRADVIDYKTGSEPSKAQAYSLLSPQLALEGALLERGAFRAVGPLQPADLAYVRLRANGWVIHESILDHKSVRRSASDLAHKSWRRLEELLLHYAEAKTGYLSRALPFRENEVEGDYDHLARVLEWSAGADEPTEADW